jgi:hypothetical protein
MEKIGISDIGVVFPPRDCEPRPADFAGRMVNAWLNPGFFADRH